MAGAFFIFLRDLLMRWIFRCFDIKSVRPWTNEDTGLLHKCWNLLDFDFEFVTTPHSCRLNFLKESYAYRWYGELSTPCIVDAKKNKPGMYFEVGRDYLKVWKKAYLRLSWRLPALLLAVRRFSISNISSSSKPKSASFQQSCKLPCQNRFIKKNPHWFVPFINFFLLCREGYFILPYNELAIAQGPKIQQKNKL